MRVAVLTREYPPEVYGGAGVHVEHLTRHLGNYCDLEVHCFGPPRVAEPPIKAVFSYQPWVELDGEERYLDALRPMSVNLAMAAKLGGTDIVHSHTWYTNLAGHLAKSLHDVPHVVTVHSLEPKRPWKQDQIGSGYRISSFCERSGLESADAIIAVSASVADDIVESYPLVDPARIRVIPNAIDTEEWRPDSGTEIFDTFNINPGRPIVLYVGRITPQKGIKHLIAAAQHFDPSVQLVLRAGPADTPELEKEFSEQLDALRARRGGIIWIKEFLDPPQLSQLLSHSTVSCCPSVYEPFGLVNLEAMACEVPVVGSAVGGIPEVIDDGITGILVPVEFAGSGGIEPADPERFAHDLALAINVLIANPHLAHKMGQLGRRRVLENFTWSVSARRTYDLYGELRHQYPAIPTTRPDLPVP